MWLDNLLLRLQREPPLSSLVTSSLTLSDQMAWLTNLTMQGDGKGSLAAPLRGIDLPRAAQVFCRGAHAGQLHA